MFLGAVASALAEETRQRLEWLADPTTFDPLALDTLAAAREARNYALRALGRESEITTSEATLAAGQAIARSLESLAKWARSPHEELPEQPASDGFLTEGVEGLDELWFLGRRVASGRMGSGLELIWALQLLPEAARRRNVGEALVPEVLGSPFQCNERTSAEEDYLRWRVQSGSLKARRLELALRSGLEIGAERQPFEFEPWLHDLRDLNLGDPRVLAAAIGGLWRGVQVRSFAAGMPDREIANVLIALSKGGEVDEEDRRAAQTRLRALEDQGAAEFADLLEAASAGDEDGVLRLLSKLADSKWLRLMTQSAVVDFCLSWEAP